MPSHVKDKMPLLRELTKGQSVLDIGCIQHSWLKHQNSDWIHNILRESAEYIVGIDILHNDVLELRKRGYNIKLANAENFQLNEQFSVIYLGEILEHLNNVGKCLECCHQHLVKGGKLIVTVPNCFSLLFTWLTLTQKLQVNTEHTCWYDEITIRQIIERYGFIVDKVYYFNRFETGNNPIKNLAAKIFSKICPYRMRDNILIVAHK